MNQPLNIYEILALIRKYDNTPCARNTNIADYLNNQYAAGNMSSEELWGMLKGLFMEILDDARYDNSIN